MVSAENGHFNNEAFNFKVFTAFLSPLVLKQAVSGKEVFPWTSVIFLFCRHILSFITLVGKWAVC